MYAFRLRFLDANPSLRTQSDLRPEHTRYHEMFLLRHAIHLQPEMTELRYHACRLKRAHFRVNKTPILSHSTPLCHVVFRWTSRPYRPMKQCIKREIIGR